MKKILMVLIFALSSNNIFCTVYSSQSDTLKIVTVNFSQSLPDSSVYINIDYPQIQDFDDQSVQNKVNSFLKDEFLQSVFWYEELKSDKSEPTFEQRGYSYSFETGFEIMYNSKNFISIKLDHYQFTGGAHGNYYSTGYNISMINGNSLKLSDIVNSDSFDMLSYECEQAILDSFQVNTLTEAGLFEDEVIILPDQDFYIVPGALVLQFDPYEIAPYVMGEINVAIPFDRIKDILKTNLPFSTN